MVLDRPGVFNTCKLTVSGAGTPESPSTASAKSKIPLAAGVAAGVVALLAIAIALLLWQRARRHSRTALVEKADLPGGTLAPIGQAGLDAAALAEELRVVKDQLHRLAERVDGSSTAVSYTDATFLRPSLSMMKRDQTRNIRNQRPASVAHDALVHTDRGLRLTAGSRDLVDELPPNYVAE